MSTQQANPGEVTERVSMVWPADLKAKVRRLVGARGLTDFTLDAVRDKLGRLENHVQVERSEPPDEPVADSTDGQPRQPRERNGQIDPAMVATLPLADRMRYARELIEQRESASSVGGASPRCPSCKEELVNGECWTCLPAGTTANLPRA